MSASAYSASLYSYISYAEFSGDERGVDLQANRRPLEEQKFSISQINRISQNLKIDSYRQNTDNGFSATLIKSSDAAIPTYVFAIRVTDQVIKDGMSADLGGLILRGAAFGQIVDLYNYWMRLIAPRNSSVGQIRIVRRPTIGGGALTVINTGIPYVTSVLQHYNAAGAGIGAFEGVEAPRVVVTGHSLGGHLATAFERLFPGAVDSVLTFNSAGTRNSPLVNQFFDVLAGRPTFSDASKITSFYGSSGLNTVAGEAVYEQLGQRVEFYTEGVDKVLGHSIDPVHDSLAIHEVFCEWTRLWNRHFPSSPIATSCRSSRPRTLKQLLRLRRS